jgi:hypothetical protein
MNFDRLLEAISVMKLYHGTSADRIDRILEEGLLPRELSKEQTNFADAPSHEGCVYLSHCYAPYFASVATAENAGRKAGLLDKLKKARSRFALIEVDVRRNRLRPDEDFLEQATRDTQNMPPGTMLGRTMWFRERLERYSHLWVESLSHLGTVAHHGAITPDEITRVVEFDPRTNAQVASLCADPSISLLNHHVLARKYETLTKWFFERLDDVEILKMAGLDHLINVHESQRAEVEGAFGKYIEWAREAARNRKGLKVRKNGRPY